MTDAAQHLRPRSSKGWLLFIVVAASAMHAAAATKPGAHATAATPILDVRAHRFIDEAALVARIAPVRYRLLGEIHDNPVHHRLRAQLIEEIARSGRRPGVVMEQLELGRDAALADAQRRGGDADALGDAGALDKRAWQWPLHAPVIEAARRAQLPLHGGGLASSALRTGVPAANPAWRARLQRAAWGPPQETALRRTIEASHCGQLRPEQVPRLAEAQRWRDAAMAEAVVQAATADGTILIAGDGHVRRDLGVPRYLPSGEVVSVGFVEGPDADTPYDYVWYTEPASRDDPCAAFTAPRKR